jgi:superfamily II DNA or RNA helicase
MSIWIPLDSLDRSLRDKIGDDLTVIQLDEAYEKMKKRGKITPGYIIDQNNKILCFHIDSEESRNLWMPYFYARSTFKIIPNLERYPMLDEALENKVILRDNQIETVEKCFHNLVQYGATTVGLPPGYGKTYIGAYLSHCLKLKVLVVVPRSPLLEQWKKTFNIAIPNASIWIIDEKSKIPEEFTFNSLPDVTIALDPRLSKIPSEWKSKFGTLIIDEAHMLPTRGRIENLLSIRPAYIIMETATMVRTDGLHKICELIGGTHGMFKTANDPYSFKIVDLSFIHVSEKSGPRGIDYNALCDELSETDEYNRIIVNIVRHNPKNKFIILTKRVEHGNHLMNLFKKAEITCDIMMGTKKNYINSRVLIGTFSKIGTGFDEATASKSFEGNLSDSLIICHSVAKESNFEQYRGRVMRTKNPTVYWLNVGNRVIRSQLTNIKKHVLKTNGTINIVNGINYLYESPEKIPGNKD